MMRAYTKYPLYLTVVYAIEKHVHYNYLLSIVNLKNLKDVTCFICLKEGRKSVCLQPFIHFCSVLHTHFHIKLSNLFHPCKQSCSLKNV